VRKIVWWGVVVFAAIMWAIVPPAMAAATVNTTLYNVTITSEPTGAAAFINGEFYGITPIHVQLPPGTYLLELISKDSGKWTTSFTVPGTQIIKVTLKSEGGSSSTMQNFNEEAQFRVGPIVKIDYQRTVINETGPGIVSFYFSNPTVNDVSLSGDVYIELPDGVYIDGGSWFTCHEDTGIAHAHFEVPPGKNTIATVRVYAERPGIYYLQGYVLYYPDHNKASYRIMHLSKRFVCEQPVVPSPKPTPTPTPEDDDGWIEKIANLGDVETLIIFCLTLVAIVAVCGRVIISRSR